MYWCWFGWLFWISASDVRSPVEGTELFETIAAGVVHDCRCLDLVFPANERCFFSDFPVGESSLQPFHNQVVVLPESSPPK
jgi:hypothetical protein